MSYTRAKTLPHGHGHKLSAAESAARMKPGARGAVRVKSAPTSARHGGGIVSVRRAMAGIGGNYF